MELCLSWEVSPLPAHTSPRTYEVNPGQMSTGHPQELMQALLGEGSCVHTKPGRDASSVILWPVASEPSPMWSVGIKYLLGVCVGVSQPSSATPSPRVGYDLGSLLLRVLVPCGPPAFLNTNLSNLSKTV